MPINYSLYPANWSTEIRPRILKRANYQCEWCGVPNNELGYRNGGEWIAAYDLAGDMGLCEEDYRAIAAVQGIRLYRIILTIAHLDHTLPDGTTVSKHDKRHEHDEALAALCQSCHLRYDHADHIRHAAESRRLRQIEAGQTVLL